MSERKEDKNNVCPPVSDSQDIKKAGILRKLKTMKKKYFVLRTESSTGPARLEYYDNEKKFKSGGAAKRSIPIKTCFNINRKVDAKHKFAITLYTKDDSFSVVADNEESVEEWLNAMLELQLDGPCLTGGAKLKPKFEHVWQVTVGDKSLASSRNMKGLYRLCLTPSSLTLIKVDQSDPPETLEFPLMSIRRCGHTNNYFVIELGRSSVTGAGELWLETEDVVIAQNMHEVTLNAMKSCREHEDIGPHMRPRSASNSENSRPITTRPPRPIAVVSPQAYAGFRDRCDSLPPSSRPRTISEGQEVNSSFRSYYTPQSYMDSLRPYGGFNRTMSYSPPTLTNPLSPVSATCSTDSAGSSLSIDEFDGCQQTDFAHGRYIHNLPTDGALHTEPPIKEEDYVPMTMGNNNNNTEGYISMAPTMMSSSAPTRPSIFLHLNSVNSTHTSSLPPSSQTNDYMEMKSPMDGYINMSPIGATLDVQSSSPRDSSLHDSSQTNDGYIHMAPVHNHASPQQHEGYLDMAPLSSSLPKTFSVSANQAINLPSRKDSNSKLSETAVSSPGSTNLEDFPLDKVKSFLADADDASFDSYIRPVRAYSMGSRPQPKKSHLSLQVDGSRIRAYSVGSQAQRKISNPLDKEIGNLIKIDPRTGAKSSSAPLLNNRPPRIRSSTSRGDVGEDLMEIDYNKTKYSSGIDSDSFTIEPVGRARSGSYSSSTNNALKLLHNRDKIKSQSTGHSSNSVKDDADNATDYLTMSPLIDHSKSRKNSSSTSKSDLISKKLEILHPPGDYVSLDPSCTYMSGDKYLTGANNNSNERTNVSPINQELKNNLVTSTLSKANDNEDKSSAPHKESVNGEIVNYSPKKVEKQSSSDYMCMNYGHNLENNESDSKVLLSPNSHSLHSPSSLEKEECESSIVKNSLQDKQLNMVSPSSKTASSVSNSVPKTPPPSPSYGPSSNSFSTLPLVDNVVRRLSQPTNASTVQPAPNCGEIRLNYASLDLPPASEEDGRGNTTKLKKSEEEAQDGLTYAQIDFSLVRQKAFQEPESLSHL